MGPSTVTTMRGHRLEQMEIKIAVGHRSDLVFATVDGNPPDYVTTDWRRVLAAKGLPSVNFHALRHTHASALIASGLNIVSVSRRLGHGSPTITLNTYAHLDGGRCHRENIGTEIGTEINPRDPRFIRRGAVLDGTIND